ncbi:pentapeptide repeat-containing protein [Paenibacillus sinopodophylli]|uniref:pentapeptide repeat-containing protein n=1 Tax=Paenibacillus sinopodophylli TaxID=1837342 RepID=UPI001FE94C8F|nr:pentapeptide repeat-containing protein [Paenibacillus sinopodophylli]
MMDTNEKRLKLEMTDISGSSFHKVNAEASVFDDVNLAQTKITNANMSQMSIHDANLSKLSISNVNFSEYEIKNANMSHGLIEHVQLFGTEFRNIMLPDPKDAPSDADSVYKPIVFQQSDLRGIQFHNCNLSHADLRDCDITGLRINGILIEDLLKSQQ